MSISEAASYPGPSDDLCCPRCNLPFLPQAAFCSSCGERLDKKKALSSLLQDEQDITTHYRITSLIRRRPRVNLYFAIDNQQSRLGQQRMVAIRDIDITPLHPEARAKAIELVQHEHDLLRLWRLPHVMPVVDLRYFQGHLFVVTGYPSKPSGTATTGNIRRLYTLQDCLQSGHGIPSEQQTLKWIWYLCHALEGLHRHQIIIGELDPYTIILNENSIEAEPALLISWLPPRLRDLFPPLQASTTPFSYFSAPEELQDNAEPRSDIYSLGAILYLLLTGSYPVESSVRTRRRLRAPRELNTRVSPHVNDCVMQALSIEPTERFQSAGEMAEALHNPRFHRSQTTKSGRRDNEITHTPGSSVSDVETIRIVPLSQTHLDRWRASRPQTAISGQIPHRPLTPRPTSQPQEVEAIQSEWQPQPVASLPSAPLPATPAINANVEAQSITPGEQVNEKEVSASQRVPLQGETTILTWFKQLQGVILGQQQRAFMAAAIIESPISVQPNQAFTIRMHIIGRDEPNRSAGLSSFMYGDTVSIEIRSVLHHRYIYIVQQATITMPASGYVAEVTIPVQPLSSAPSGRRDQLHIFFLNKQRRPIYEKPFVVEVFISHLVKRGHEGHHVLTIPL